MESLEFIDAALEVFKNKNISTTRYAEEVSWLKQRYTKWKNDKVRVGVIGVTSSGKSTLINAILGDQLLSTAVKPSSSQLVSCTKADKRKAVVTFESGDKKVLSDETLTMKNLKAYTDEEENSNNEKNVSDIQLATPHFDLDDQVILIDSAGLDAYKLESHEKLSLEVLLPTIDMCIFVTTLKTNSDAKARMVLNSIARHNCPIIIVQNMIDSVEASADGSKTKEMVALEHKARIRRIINQSNISKKDRVKIVQISALIAMKNRCNSITPPKESNYNSLINQLKEMIEVHLPQIDIQRSKSIYSKFSEVIKDEKLKTTGVTVTKNGFKYSKVSDQLRKKSDLLQRGLSEELKKLSVSYIKRDLSGDLDTKNIDVILSDIKNRVKQCEDNILRLITSFNEEISKTAKILDIPLRDIIKVEKFDSIKGPQKIVNTVMKSKRVKKTQKISKFTRWLGEKIGNSNWGYEYRDMPVKELNKTRTIKEIEKYASRAQNIYQRTLKKWKSGVDESLRYINSEVDHLYKSYLDRQNKIEEEDDVIWIVQQLEKLINQLDIVEKEINEVSGSKKKSDSVISNLSKVPMTKYQTGILGLSRIILQKINQSSLRLAHTYIRAPEYQMVIAWDMNCLNNFSWRFMGQNLEEEHQKTLEKSGELILEKFSYIFNPSIKKLKRLKFNYDAISIYILVNAHQDGSAKNQINDLELKSHITNDDKVFFVIQDFDSLILSDGVSEMKRNVLDYYTEFSLETNKGLLLINDDNPIFNLAFTQSQIKPCESLLDEQEMIKVLKERFSYLFYDNANDVVGKLIRTELEGNLNEEKKY